MRIQLNAGTGVGQYANILTYNNGSKIAKIYKDSFTTLTVTGSTASADTLTVASTATLYANMPIFLASAIGGAANGATGAVSRGISAGATDATTNIVPHWCLDIRRLIGISAYSAIY